MQGYRMNKAVILDNGDLRLPADIASRLNAKPGEEVELEAEADGTVRIYPKLFSPEEVFGFLSRHTAIKSTIEQMDESIAEACRKVDM